ncbi:hypothetical protein K435DRAFT_871064 [Dendrothele bispora CBS 962.96]|uniref:Uncharacterized protein n=1 Tax=Dendrothele bispora (strain CBS 962.96) TaxID=1314807 RepID=A0A4S8L5F7_DENBC|nr:hypothetical protein K435DRAFT_871064 [Dendrothele bispora CBS 962.96]
MLDGMTRYDGAKAALLRDVACLVAEFDSSLKLGNVGWREGEEGIIALLNAACDALLSASVESKPKGSKINTVVNRIHVAMPKKRDDVVRDAFIPETVRENRDNREKMYDKDGS